MQIQIDPELYRASQQRLHLGVLSCRIQVQPSCQKLRDLLTAEAQLCQQTYQLEDLAKIPEVVALRDTYKQLGKKPQKYRGSNEALLRRSVKGVDLYSVNNVVDLNNLLSLRSRRSVGSFDLGKIEGPVRFGIGQEQEAYVGIGRGQLNIAKLPVFRDARGAFGSPTSDSERTRIQAQTQALLLIIIAFDGATALQEQLQWAETLLTQFASGSRFSHALVTP